MRACLLIWMLRPSTMYIDKKTSTALLHPRVTYFIPVLGDLKRFPAVTLKLYTYTSTLVEPCHLNKSSCSFQLIASTLSRSIIKSAPKLRRLAASTTARSLVQARSEEHTSELQSLAYLVCRLLLEKKK